MHAKLFTVQASLLLVLLGTKRELLRSHEPNYFRPHDLKYATVNSAILYAYLH